MEVVMKNVVPAKLPTGYAVAEIVELVAGLSGLLHVLITIAGDDCEIQLLDWVEEFAGRGK